MDDGYHMVSRAVTYMIQQQQQQRFYLRSKMRASQEATHPNMNQNRYCQFLNCWIAELCARCNSQKIIILHSLVLFCPY